MPDILRDRTITCIKSDVERITHFHVKDSLTLEELLAAPESAMGAEELLTVREAITDLERRSYYVRLGDDRVPVLKVERDGTVYLRTKSDKTEENNLASLPECRCALYANRR